MRTLRRASGALTMGLVLGIGTAAAGESEARSRPSAIGPLALGDSKTQLVYTPVAPCRIVDTRLAGGTLVVESPRSFRVTGVGLDGQGGSLAGCNVPSGRTTAALVNFVAVNSAGPGNLRAWAYRVPAPPPPAASVLNYARIAGSGLNIANGIAIPTCDATESGQTCPFDFRVQADGSGTHLVVDVVGFFERFPTEEVPLDELIPAGAIVVWDQSDTCPPGYTRVGTLDGRFARGGSAPGETGGADSHAHSMSHRHEMANHTHGGTTGTAAASACGTFSPSDAASATHTHTFTTGGPSPSLTNLPSPGTSGSASSLPPYVDVLFCRRTGTGVAEGPPPAAFAETPRTAENPRPAAKELLRGAIEPLALGDSNELLVYTPVAPCRIIDTRAASGSLLVGTPRDFRVTGADHGSQGGDPAGCQVPFGRATAALVNFVAVNPAGAGNLRAWAYRTPPTAPPTASVLNYGATAGSGLNIANGLPIPICDPTESGQACAFDFRVQADGNGTHLVADVVGFFEPFPTEQLVDLALPPGAVVLWDQSANCPAGYARVETFDGRFLRGAPTVGGTGGTDMHTHDMSHTHGMASHTHGGTTSSSGSGVNRGGPGNPRSVAATHSHTLTTGGPSINVTGGADPGVSGSASGLPPYFDVLFCRRIASAPPRPSRPAQEPRARPSRSQAGGPALGDSKSRLVYSLVAPCRIVDTRLAGASLPVGIPRDFRATGVDLSQQGGSAAGCHVPFGRATAALVNFVAVNAVGPGNLRVWAYRTPPPGPPNSSVLNYALIPGSGLNVANGIAIPICDPTEAGQTCPSDFRAQADGSGTHMVADVVGFFERFPIEQVAPLVPAGTMILWDQSSECPAGYTRAVNLDGRFPRAASQAGGTGGGETHTHDLPHTHGMAGHTHGGTTGSSGTMSTVGDLGAAAAAAHSHAFTTGGPSSDVTDGADPGTSSPASSLPRYVGVLFCRKQ